MTCSTSRPNGTIPPLGSQRPLTPATAHVPRREIGQCAFALVGVLDTLPRGTPRAAARRGDPVARLDRGLLIGRDHHIARVQQLALPAALVEIEHPARLDRNSGSVGKIHERYCHGLIASSRSHRTIVDADASLIPRSITSR